MYMAGVLKDTLFVLSLFSLSFLSTFAPSLFALRD
jgi:hypothetical protein